MIRIFEEVRDMPYRLAPELASGALHPSKREIKEGLSCFSKHFLLGSMFEKEGLAVRYVTYGFNWRDQKIAFPPKVRALSEKMPTEYHLACKVLVGDRWVLVDATWDLVLEKANFPVNRAWDGETDTLNAVKPLYEVAHKDARERVSYVSKKRALFAKEERSACGRFIVEFNKWLSSVRD